MTPSTTSNAEIVQLLRQLQTSSSLTPQQQQWVAQQLARNVSGEAPAETTATPSVLGVTGTVGNAMSQINPRGNPRVAGIQSLGTGIGQLMSGLGALRKKGQGQGASPTYNDPEDYQPDVAQRRARPATPGTGPDFTPPAPGTTPPVVTPPTLPGAQVPIDEEDLEMRRGGRVRRAFARGGEAAEDLPAAPAKPLRAVIVRKPGGSEPDGAGRHLPIPVLHTTIVIGMHKKPPRAKAKAKPAKKAKGGRIQPRKPAAVPPVKGPGNGSAPAPFAKGGHVQVPRGSGCAQRGKKFGGIY